MTTADTLRESISRETSRGRPACNELILRDLIDWIEGIEMRVAQVETAHGSQPCAECARRRDFAIDQDYTDKLAVYIDELVWFSPQEYWDDCDDGKRADLDGIAAEEYDRKFLDLDPFFQWEILGELPDHTVSGWDDRWEYVCAHLTRDAADAFISRKKHDYPDGLRVAVEAQVYCWEFNAIKEAILSGRLQFVDAPMAPGSDVDQKKESA